MIVTFKTIVAAVLLTSALGADLSTAPFSTASVPLHVALGGAITATKTGAIDELGSLKLLDTTSINASFILRNTSTQPVTINALPTSCGCTTATLPEPLPYTVEAGSWTTVTVNIDPSDAGIGEINKTAYVQTSAGDMDLTVDATLTAPAHFAADSVNFGQLKIGQTRSVNVAVDVDRRVANIPFNITATTKSVTIHKLSETVQADGDHQLVYAVTLTAPSRVGKIANDLFFQPSVDTLPDGRLYPPVWILLKASIVDGSSRQTSSAIASHISPSP